MAEKVPVSVLICTCNEELNIHDCLESVVHWADQVFVVDSLSEDRTLEICKGFGVDVVSYTDRSLQFHERLGPQRNWALENLPFHNEWVLILDADERVLPGLRDEIREIVKNEGHGYDGFYVNRRYIFYGKWIRHSGWYPSWNLRLFRHRLGRYESRQIHVHVILNGKAGYCRNDLLHEDLRDMGSWISRQIHYTTFEAQEYLRSVGWGKGAEKQAEVGHGSVRWKRIMKERLFVHLPCRGLIKFIYLYFIRLGFLDGMHGLRFCVMWGIFEHVINMRVWELRHYKEGAPAGGIAVKRIFEQYGDELRGG